MEHHCPMCGAEIEENSPVCAVCKAGVEWRDGKPSAASANPFWKLVLAIILLAMTLMLIYRILTGKA